MSKETQTPLQTESEGARLILLERNEQIETHGFDEDHDKANNNEELLYAAIFLLNPEKYKGVYPSWWKKEWKEKFASLTKKERIIKAGSLLAAEYDRELAQEKIDAPIGAGGSDGEKQTVTASDTGNISDVLGPKGSDQKGGDEAKQPGGSGPDGML